MSYKVKINNKDIIEVDTGNTILEVALENNIDFPHGCRSGNCGACKSKIISGDVEMSPYSEFALEEEDKNKETEEKTEDDSNVVDADYEVVEEEE